MKKTILLALLAASPVWATGNNDDPEAVAIAGAEADATAGATATSTIEMPPSHNAMQQ